MMMTTDEQARALLASQYKKRVIISNEKDVITQQALFAIEEALEYVPEGYVLVPSDPKKAEGMIKASWREQYIFEGATPQEADGIAASRWEKERESCFASYSAMIANATTNEGTEMTKITQEQALDELVRAAQAGGMDSHKAFALRESALTQQASVSGLEWRSTILNESDELVFNDVVIGRAFRRTENLKIVGYAAALGKHYTFDTPPRFSTLSEAKTALENAAREWLKMPAPAPMPSREEVSREALAETIFRAHWPNDNRPWVSNDDGSSQEHQKAYLRAADAVLELIRKTQETK